MRHRATHTLERDTEKLDAQEEDSQGKNTQEREQWEMNTKTDRPGMNVQDGGSQGMCSRGVASRRGEPPKRQHLGLEPQDLETSELEPA